MSRSFVLALAIAFATQAQPAHAEATPPAPVVKDPRTAALWSGAPAAALGTISLIGLLPVLADPVTEHPIRNLMPAFVPAPLLFGAGHFYAGDPVRGSLITLGGPVVTLAGFMAGATLISPLMPQVMTPMGYPQNRALGDGFVTGVVACYLYGAWATWDAYQTAERLNQARAQAVRPPLMARP